MYPYDGEQRPIRSTPISRKTAVFVGQGADLSTTSAQVGPLANVLAMYIAGHEPTKRNLEMH